MTAKTMAEVLAEQLCGWNEDAPCGDCLDDAERYVGVMSAAGFGLVADAKAEALEEAADDFEGNVGVGEFAELSTRDGNPWGHVEESWEHQGPYMDWLRNRAAVLRGDS